MEIRPEISPKREPWVHGIFRVSARLFFELCSQSFYMGVRDVMALPAFALAPDIGYAKENDSFGRAVWMSRSQKYRPPLDGGEGVKHWFCIS
jgi:hypothetical protein